MDTTEMETERIEREAEKTLLHLLVKCEPEQPEIDWLIRLNNINLMEHIQSC